MKAIKKLLVLMMAAVLSLSVFSFAGCNEAGNKIKIDKTKTQVYVSNFNGGFGSTWLTEGVIKRFEKEYEDYEGVDGKVGVQVVPDIHKITGEGIMNAMKAGNKNDVFFTEGVNYYDFVTSGAVLDITTEVSTPLTEYGETESILDKMTPAMQEALKVGETKKIYMVPHYAGYNGITLDIDLMDTFKLFILQNGNFGGKEADKCTVVGDKTSGKLSAGPDDIFGTYDDGLPATYDEFFGLMEAMTGRGITPIAWSGQHQWYVQTMMVGMAANAMGAANAEAMYTFSKDSMEVVKAGTAKNLSNADDPWNIQYDAETVQLSGSNGYEIFRQPAFLTTLSVLDNIIDNEYYHSKSFNPSVSNMSIQTSYLMSRLDAIEPIGMLVEGCWWEQEAVQSFKNLADKYGEEQGGRLSRRLRFLPFPHTGLGGDVVGRGQVLLEANNAYGFINANVPAERKDIALKFLRFINTDVSLREFSTITNTTKALDYKLTDEDKAKMSYFGRSLMDIQSADSTTIVYPVSTSQTFISKKNLLTNQELWKNGKTKMPTAFYKESKSNSSVTYFNTLADFWKGSWN